MRRLLVNDCLTAIPGTRTFWSDLQEWFSMEFRGGAFEDLESIVSWECGLAEAPDAVGRDPKDWDLEKPSLIIRNASYFPPLKASEKIPTISLLQDIFTEGPMREMQLEVLASSVAVFNSAFTQSKYEAAINRHIRKMLDENETDIIIASDRGPADRVIPLPVDFSVFEPQNAMGCQQALGLPDGCICWIGASQGPAGHVKGFDIFQKIVRLNPDLHFVGVFKDALPDAMPPNMRAYLRLTHEELVKVIGACRVGLCTSRTESQHLAGIEMGACGLPLVVPPVGTYWNRTDWPGMPVRLDYVSAIRTALTNPLDPNGTRNYWKREFDREVIRKQWETLIHGVENGSHV